MSSSSGSKEHLRPETIHEVFKTQWPAGQQPKITKEALEMVGEMVRLFTTEAIHRSATISVARARREQKFQTALAATKPELSIQDLEVILPQLLLDFS
ncbi:hypothetical protein H9P43_009871 [Blastocladiella emersonii ATCC 22665]|nr:hypothetical protein H9P43_009871 [Blastocladiella emersonii ATCC 22665]